MVASRLKSAFGYHAQAVQGLLHSLSGPPIAAAYLAKESINPSF